MPKDGRHGSPVEDLRPWPEQSASDQKDPDDEKAVLSIQRNAAFQQGATGQH